MVNESQSGFVGATVSLVYLDEVGDACRGSEDDPLVHGNGLLVLVFLDRDVPPEEQQRERRHLSAIVQEDLRTHREMLQKCVTSITTNSVTGRHRYDTLRPTAIL